MQFKSLGLRLATLASVLVANRADAAFMAAIANDPLIVGGGDTIVTDQGPGDNFPGSAIGGQINAGAISINGFTIVANVSQSKPLTGSAAAPELVVTFTATTVDNNPHTVYLFASDTGYTAGGPLYLALSGNQLPSDNSITGRAWGSTTNTNLDFTNLLAQTVPTSTPQYAVSTFGVFPGTTPYALTLGVEITRTTAGTTNGTFQLSTVPEPTCAALLTLTGTALLARRRKL